MARAVLYPEAFLQCKIVTECHYRRESSLLKKGWERDTLFFFSMHIDMPLTKQSDLLTQGENVHLRPLYLTQACSA